MKPCQLAVDQAAGAGDIEALNLLWDESNGTLFPRAAGLQMAAAAGKICTLEWAHSRGLPGFQGLMDIAAWKGRLSVLKWLQAFRNEGCTTKATTWAAQR
ncbi:unnamed protein product [Ectocarpus sp. 13 AM-2016]